MITRSNFQRSVLISFLTLFFISNFSYADIPKLKNAVGISGIKIIQSEPKTGKLALEISFEARISINGSFRINAHRGVHLWQNTRQVKDIRQSITLVKSQTMKKTFVFQVDSGAYGMVEIIVETPGVPPGYGRSIYKYLKFFNDGKSIHLIEPRKSDIFQPKESGKDFRIRKGSIKSITRTLQVYQVNVSGRVKFWPKEGGDYKGVYGNDIVLWFRNSSNPDNWYHPVVGNQQHVHYDALDPQGNFNFNFSFEGDLSGYDQLILLISTTNKATILPVPPDGYIVYHNNGFSTYYNESEGLVAWIGASQSNITISQDIILNAPEGAIFRYMMFARDFLYALYDGNLPFSLPAIQTQVKDISTAGIFVAEWDPINGTSLHIEIDPFWYDVTTVTHEYGHYVNYQMWGNYDKFNAATDEVVEGWAIFHSFAVRNYINRHYGDDLRDWDDNTEIAPFETNPRFRNIRYTQAGEPDKAASASVFWNLYDDYANLEFETIVYDDGDNDDISSYKKRVFERFRTFNTTNILGQYDLRTATYKDHFKMYIPPSDSMDVVTQNSVDKIYDFMFSDLYQIPSQKMRAAQVTNFHGIVKSNSQINFNWVVQNYGGNLFYGNYESGYNLYKENGSSWSLIATIPFGNTSYTYTSSNISGRYKITSYNSGGESSRTPIFSPLTINITGPTLLQSGQTGTFTANVQGGTPPYQYAWYKYRSCGGPLSLTGITPQFYAPCNLWQFIGSGQTVQTSDNLSFNLKVEVTDATQQVTSAEHFVEVGAFGAVAGTAVSENKVALIPHQVELSANYPNPFNPTTIIRFGLPQKEHVRLIVYSILGQKVAMLLNREMPAGYHQVEWAGKNGEGNPVASGVYIYELKAGGKRLVRKMLLVR